MNAGSCRLEVWEQTQSIVCSLGVLCHWVLKAALVMSDG